MTPTIDTTTSPSPTTPKRKSILHNSSPSSPSTPTRGDPPSSPSSVGGSPSSHTYTSLASVRRANKGKEPERGDRKNGWHLWSVEESQSQARANGTAAGGGDEEEGGEERARREVMDEKKGERRMTQWDLICMTMGMLGAQIAWCLEMGFGSIELIDLGLPESATALVWLAGPLSGLITQPLIGAISDASTSRFRRRYWIALSTGIMILSFLALAFARPIGHIAADIRGVGEGEWDPKWKNCAKGWSIGTAVVAFYGLDFAVNALQASMRNLLLDVTPAEQLNEGNAWIGRMSHLGNIVGFTLGFIDLSSFAVLSWLGGGNFRKLCVIIMFLLAGSVWVTCWTTTEIEREKEFGVRTGRLRDITSNIYNSILHLPRPIRRVCYVQLFAFMSWFPFLFFGTQWVSEVMRASRPHATKDEAAQAGSLAMLIYSIVAVVAGTVLPYLADRDRRLLAPDLLEEDEDLTDEEREFKRIKELVSEWKAEAKRDSKELRLPTMPFMLRNIWTAALLLFSFLMFLTFFVKTVWQSTVIVAAVGACWAVAAWVPFSLLMEYLKEMQERALIHAAEPPTSSHVFHQHPPPVTRPPGLHARAASTPGRMWAAGIDSRRQTSMDAIGANERTNLLKRRHSMVDTTELDDEGEDRMKSESSGPVAGGTVLGVHNLAIVFPQFVVAIISSFIFKAVASAGRPGDQIPPPGSDDFVSGGGGDSEESSGTAWVLRFGGLCALFAAAISRRVPPTKTEKAMRRRLAEMRELEASDED